jgi:hypothetical protein
VLTGERITLRPVHEADLATAYAAHTDIANRGAFCDEQSAARDERSASLGQVEQPQRLRHEVASRRVEASRSG